MQWMKITHITLIYRETLEWHTLAQGRGKLSHLEFKIIRFWVLSLEISFPSSAHHCKSCGWGAYVAQVGCCPPVDGSARKFWRLRVAARAGRSCKELSGMRKQQPARLAGPEDCRTVGR